MSVSLTALSDVELLSRVREGCDESFAELWRRHYRAATSFAGRYRDLADPEDVAQEAFLRIRQSVAAGGGPFHSFRPYLYRTVRNIAVSAGRAAHDLPAGTLADIDDRDDVADRVEEDPSAKVLERSIILRAYNRLPSRWQEVLWYGAVEDLKPRQIAPLLGLSSNGVSALIVRAREGLRQEWLRAHTQTEGIAAECRRIVDELPEYTRRRLSADRQTEVHDHIDRCPRCASVYAELGELNGRLGSLLLPAILLPASPVATMLGPACDGGLGGLVSDNAHTVPRGAEASSKARHLHRPRGRSALTKGVGIVTSGAVAGLGVWGVAMLPRADAEATDAPGSEVRSAPPTLPPPAVDQQPSEPAAATPGEGDTHTEPPDLDPGEATADPASETASPPTPSAPAASPAPAEPTAVPEPAAPQPAPTPTPTQESHRDTRSARDAYQPDEPDHSARRAGVGDDSHRSHHDHPSVRRSRH